MANVKGGGARPARLTSSGPVQAGPAQRVYLYLATPGDRAAIGGAAQPVRVITDADLRANGGQYTLSGDVEAWPMYVAANSTPVQGGAALPIYVVGP